MARIEHDNSVIQSFHYLSISNGKFRETTTFDNPKAVKRTTKNGNEKYELVFSAIEGYITKIEITENGYEGAELCEVLLEDKDEKNLIQLQTNSSIFRSLSKRFPSLDPKKEVKFSVFESKEGYTQIATWQGETVVQDAFKEDPKLPQGEEIKGQKYKNFHDQKEYLKLKAVDVYMNKKGDWTPTFEVVPPTAKDIPVPTQKDEPLPKIGDEDLPF